MIIKRFFLFCLIILFGSLSVHMFSYDFAGKLTEEDQSKLLAKGSGLYKSSGCISCHGDRGNNPIDETYPLIGGQPKKYLKQQIIDIRDGKRSNGSSSIMSASIRGLTDEEAYMISFYLSKE